MYYTYFQAWCPIAFPFWLYTNILLLLTLLPPGGSPHCYFDSRQNGECKELAVKEQNKTTGTHTVHTQTPTYLRIKTTLWGIWDQILPQPPTPSTRVSSSSFVCFFVSFLSFCSQPVFLSDSQLLSRSAAVFSEVLTGSFARLLRTSKCVWHVHLGGPRWERACLTLRPVDEVLKALCVSTLLTFKGARTVLTLTWLLWIKCVSSLSQQLQ